MNLLRAVLAFLALPGIVAFVVPLLLVEARESRRFDLIGLIPLLPGIAGLLWCVRSFYVDGKGTLAPWSPPRRLVVGGLYRYSRNPMYVSVVLILWGWAAAFESRTLAIYALVVMAAFHLRVVFGEEPWLARAHGDAWNRYKAEVPRWLTRRSLVAITVAALAVVALLVTVPVVGITIMNRGEDYAHRTAFDAAEWQSRSLDGDPLWPTRLRMIDDLMRSRRLEGLSRAQVRQLLGPADETDQWRDWEAVYWLGPERGFIRIDSEWLVLRFNAAGRVAEHEVVAD